VLAIDRHVGAHVARELHAVDAGCGGQHAGAAQLGELDRQRSDSARGAVNDDGLAFLEP